jgi:hypothetical protein
MSLRVPAGICTLALLLTGCGGGGGGGGDRTFSVSFNTSSISISVLEGGPTQSSSTAVIQASGSGPRPDGLFIGATRTGQGVQLPIQVAINEAAMSATITVLPDNTLPGGTYTGTLTLLACKDASCSAHYRGSPHNVSYTVTIEPRLAAVPSAVSLNGVETTIGSPVPVQIRAPSGATVTSSITYSQGQGWLSATVQGSTLTLTPNASGLAAGTYQAEVQLRTTTPAQLAQVPVTLTLASALQTPASFTTVLDVQTQPNALQGSFTVGVASGATVNSWSASSDAAWLVVDSTSGAPNGTLTWHLDPAELSSLTNLADHTARITVSGTGVTPVVTRITAIKQLPEITNVERLALLANEAGPVAVYGVGFNALQNPASALRVTGATPSAVSVLSDRLMTVTFPALASGAYAMTLTNQLGIGTRSKPLTVLDPVTRSYQTIATQGRKRVLLWDAITQSAFVINEDAETLLRFDLSGGSVALSTRSIPGIQGIGLPLDRSVLHVLDRNGDLQDLNTTNLTTVRTRAMGRPPAQMFLELPLPITGDNMLWVESGPGSFGYDLLNSVPKSIVDPNSPYTYPHTTKAAVSPNGQRMLMNQPSNSTFPPLLYWDAADPQIRSFPDTGIFDIGFYDARSDRQGQIWAFDHNDVRGFDIGLLAKSDAPADWTGWRRVISHDGTRMYAYSLHANAIGHSSEPNPIVHYPRVYVFDISTPPTQAVSYPIIGSFDLSDYVACRFDSPQGVCWAIDLSLAITDDDRTLIAVGDRRFIAVPIPANLRSH